MLTTDLEYHGLSDKNSIILPIPLITGSITFPNYVESMIASIDIIDDDLNDEPDSNNMVVFIDFEWPIYDFCSIKGKISVDQIG